MNSNSIIHGAIKSCQDYERLIVSKGLCPHCHGAEQYPDDAMMEQCNCLAGEALYAENAERDKQQIFEDTRGCENSN